LEALLEQSLDWAANPEYISQNKNLLTGQKQKQRSQRKFGRKFGLGSPVEKCFMV